MARQAMEMEFSVQLYEFPVHGLLDEVQRHLAKLKSVAGALFMDIKLKLTLTHPQKVQYWYALVFEAIFRKWTSKLWNHAFLSVVASQETNMN